MAERGQPSRQQLHLRGFAAAFRALERDEQTFHREIENIQHPTSKTEHPISHALDVEC
jgi:hypothetical protein